VNNLGTEGPQLLGGKYFSWDNGGGGKKAYGAMGNGGRRVPEVPGGGNRGKGEHCRYGSELAKHIQYPLTGGRGRKHIRGGRHYKNWD